MNKEFNYIDFKRYANKRLHKIKEEKITQYNRYVEAHFGRLLEDNTDKLYHIAKHYGMNMERLAIDQDATYNDVEYTYFIHDDKQYIALSKDLIIKDAGDFDINKLRTFVVCSEDFKADYEQMKDHIYKQREKRGLEHMKFKNTDPAKYEMAEKKATDDFIRQLADLKKFAKEHNIK